MENLKMMAFTTACSSTRIKQNIQLLRRRKEYGVRGSCRIKKCPQHLLICYIIPILVIFCWLPDFIVALKDVSVTIPQAVKRGSNAMLTCNYDMENDTLYSVKWYKGRREFYRYTPKENPAMKVFPSQSGLNVERNLSNQSHVVLLAVPLNISGKFTCEISVEAPSFQTAMVSGEMEVVELPEEQATVTGIQPRYRIGDLVDGNCSIKYSKPAANLTWTINGIVVPPHHIKTYQIEKYEESNLESVMSAVHFMVTTQHFIKGQMRLKCTASIFDIFKEEIESVIEEDRPRIMASGQSYPTDHGYGTHGDADSYEHNESYLTYFSAPKSSASPTADFLLFKVIKFLKHTFINNFQLLKSFIATKTKYILTMTIVNNLKSSLAPNNFVQIKITYYNALQLIMIRFMMTSLVILLVRVIWQKIQQNLLIKCLRYKLTQDKQLAHNCNEVLRQMEIFLAINLWRKTQYSNEKEQQEEYENYYRNANDNNCQTKCGQRQLQRQRRYNQQEKHCSVSNRNVFNKIASLNDTNIIIINKNTNIKNSSDIKAIIDCQHHMSQTLAFSTLPLSSCALIHLPSSLSFTSSSLHTSTSTSTSILTSTSISTTTTTLSSSLLPFSSVQSSKNRKTYAHDSFPLNAVDASESNNAKYMSKDQTLLMTLTATAANSIVVVFAVFSTLATLNSLYKIPSVFAPITATLLRALVLELKLLQTSVHSSLVGDDEQNPVPSLIFFRNNYLMAFIGELLLHQC